MGTYGILLPCDGTEPLPVSVGDHNHISEMVGGVFDAVRRDFQDEEMTVLEAPDGAEGFVAVGYLNDTGVIDQLKLNAMASVMFGQEIRGPVVVVSGTSPYGEYDGENYDVPQWFSDAVFNGGLHGLAQVLQAQAQVEAQAMWIAYNDGVFTEEEFVNLCRIMEASDLELGSQEMETLESFIAVATMYALGRSAGVIEKFDREAYEKWSEETFNLGDDEITKFWDEVQGDN